MTKVGDVPGDFKAEMDRFSLDLIEAAEKIYNLYKSLPKPSTKFTVDYDKFKVTVEDL